MTISIDLQPETERTLTARAQSKGISLSEYAQEILMREALPSELALGSQDLQADTPSLYDILAPVRGLLTDEELEAFFSRTPSPSRPASFE